MLLQILILATAVVSSSTHDGPICLCSQIYVPVCASNGKTYDNMCEFNCHRGHLWTTSGQSIRANKVGEECPQPPKS